jgi:PAS domain S-box-containing protein
MTKPTPDDRVDTATTDFDVSSILDNLPDLMFVLSRSAVIHHVNHHKDLLQPRDKIIGRPLHQLIQRPIAEQVQAAILQALDTGQSQRFEYELTVDGEKRHYAAMVSPLSKDTVTAVSRDVTHEHELQTALAGQRDFLERIFASDVVAVTVLNDEGQLVYANAEAEHVLGLVVASKDQRTVTYNDPAWLIEGVDGEPFPETSLPFVRVKTLGEPVQDVRHAIVWPDGTRKVLSINGSVLRTDAQGKREYVFAVRDITRESAIQSQLHRLSLVASQTTNAVIMTDVQGRITWVNDGFTRISGYGSEESQGHKPADLLQGPGTDPETICRMSVALQHRRPFQEDILNYHKNGTPYWLRISCNPLYDDNGQLQGFMAIESDVSREKSDAERIRDNERRLAAVIAGTRIGTWEWNVQTGETVFN